MSNKMLLATTSLAATLIAAALAVTPATAQAVSDAAADQANGQVTQSATAADKGARSGNEIVVTGSRIRRPAIDNAQPTNTIDAKLLDERGYANVADALNQLPGFGLADSSSIGNQGNGFGVGQSFVNLYGLGSQRTLTLVNGRRFVGANASTVFSSAGGGGQVDLNTIPTKLIERVDTVSIGGAPIYGSDAIAGTVNIILKHDYEGLDLDGQSGISQRGDLGNRRIRALGGKNFAGGRGNITLNAEYNQDDGLIGNQRDVIRRQYGFIAPLDPNSPYKKVLVQNVRTFLGQPGGNPYIVDGGALRPNRSVTDANGNLLRFAPDGTLIPFNTGTATSDPTTFLGGDALNMADTTNLRVDDNRFNATVLLNYQLSDGIHFFGEGWYSRSNATNVAGQPVYNTGFFRQAEPGAFDVNGNYIVKLGNPFLNPQAKATIVRNLVANGLPATDNDVFYLGRANTDLISGVARLKQNLYRFVGGFTGDFQALGHTFTWEISGNYGRSSGTSLTPSLVEPNLRRALNAGTDANGNIVCAPFNPDPNDPAAPPNVAAYAGTISQTCAPLNLFGNGAPSQAARNYVTTIARTRSITTQRDVLATLTGALAKLPGGDLGISIGYENRREYSRFTPDAYYTQALGRSIPILGVEGSYVTNEVFGEMRAPLIRPEQHIPLVREFEVNAAGRYVHNSANGGAFTWTAGGRWSLFPGFAIRGNYTRAIRAPSITELYAANQPAYDGGYDPCDQQNLTSGPNPAVRQANCRAAGLPANFSSLINSATVPVTIIGNRNLANEKASSWTIGSVFEPRFLRGLSLSADYVSIDLTDTIVASSSSAVLKGCYDSTTYPDNFYCNLVSRDTSVDNFGQITALEEPYVNQGGQVFRAVEATLAYQFALPHDIGRLTLGASYQHVIKQYAIISADTGIQSSRGQVGAGYGNFIDRGNLNATLDSGPVSWFNQILYTGPAVFDATEPAGTRDVPGVSSYVMWNTGITLHATKRFDLRINVNNVTDRGIPYPASGSPAQNAYYDALAGRAFLIGAAMHL
ncbi:TonB-dependent receptor domain-containing protein [Sphingomonas melonis]|uniref:Outer membrane receptor protein involved in Fe transport n=1 Tax=Sphingomonas melonis TaxID=152682 RepID=A0A7Y9K0X9_9SPHN|nr:outer membrane receptor protein involved in Fe transport [Sphingomonas melonis]